MILETALASVLYWQIEHALPQQCRAAAFIELVPCPCGYVPEKESTGVIASIPKLPIEEVIVFHGSETPFIYYGLGRQYKAPFTTPYSSIFWGGIPGGGRSVEEGKEINKTVVANIYSSMFSVDKHFHKHIDIHKHKVKKKEPSVVPLPSPFLLVSSLFLLLFLTTSLRRLKWNR